MFPQCSWIHLYRKLPPEWSGLRSLLDSPSDPSITRLPTTLTLDMKEARCVIRISVPPKTDHHLVRRDLPPGLIDDRTDSEASGDDDYHYHTHTTELWDTFWKPEHDERKKTLTGKSSKSRYPALIPSPQALRQRPRGPRPQPRQAWPLPDRQPEQGLKRPPTYSPFPKAAEFPPRTCSKPPCRPPRSPCCENGFLAPPVQHLPRLTVPRSSSTHLSPKSPLSPYYLPPPRSPVTSQRPATSHCARTPSHVDQISPTFSELGVPSIYSGASRSATHLPLPGQQHPHHLRPYKSNNQLYNNKPLPQPQPHSVFEYDSDSDTGHNEGISPTLAFFRFNKKSESRSATKSAHQSVEAATAAQRRRHRRKRESSMANPPTPLGNRSNSCQTFRLFHLLEAEAFPAQNSDKAMS
ncbi:hypothetical protein PT974_09371 [Cladobotryum mycophilum]|uniref:Uncharacterized protein n=1 Tax=Cladobotryum mycophilum TaxID=491253 RepID=A0ABR0SG03_9HYPO